MTAPRTQAWPCQVTEVTDGDTIRGRLRVGLDLWVDPAKIRLREVNAPERGTDAGELARDFVIALLPAGTWVQVVGRISAPRDKYGRILAAVTLPDGRDLGTVLLAEGYADPMPAGKYRALLAGTP